MENRMEKNMLKRLCRGVLCKAQDSRVLLKLLTTG